MGTLDMDPLAASLQFDAEDIPDPPPMLPHESSNDERAVNMVEDNDAARFESIIEKEVVEAGELTHFASAGKRLLCNLGKDTQSAIDLELAEELAQAYEEQDKRTSVDDDKYAAELDAALDEHCRDMTSADAAARSGSAH
jgi:hypothetical protein